MSATAASPVVYVALPRRPGFKPDGEADDRIRLVNPTQRYGLKIGRQNLSLLNYCFNRLWTAALNAREENGLTHFAMQHDDIVPQPGWVDVLIDELDATGADIVSAVVPIKDDRGLTTTGLRNGVTGQVRRLTMAEVFALPETFTLDDVLQSGIHAGGDECLLVNTGLWVCRVTDRWVDRFPGFRTADEVVRGEDGRFRAGCLSEDWLWSEWAARRGLRVAATRKVALGHWSEPGSRGTEFRNDHVWGTWQTDQGDDPQ